MPKGMDEGGSPHCYSSPKDKYRHDYFDVFKLASSKINRGFTRESSPDAHRNLSTAFDKTIIATKEIKKPSDFIGHIYFAIAFPFN